MKRKEEVAQQLLQAASEDGGSEDGDKDEEDEEDEDEGGRDRDNADGGAGCGGGNGEDEEEDAVGSGDRVDNTGNNINADIAGMDQESRSTPIHLTFKLCAGDDLAGSLVGSEEDGAVAGADTAVTRKFTKRGQTQSVMKKKTSRLKKSPSMLRTLDQIKRDEQRLKQAANTLSFAERAGMVVEDEEMASVNSLDACADIGYCGTQRDAI